MINYINIHIFKSKENIIKISLDVIMDIRSLFIMNGEINTHIMSLLCRNVTHEKDVNRIKESLNYTESTDRVPCIIFNNEGAFIHLAIWQMHFDLPTDAALALNFLSACEIFFESHSFFIRFNKESIYKLVKENADDFHVGQYFENGKLTHSTDPIAVNHAELNRLVHVMHLILQDAKNIPQYNTVYSAFKQLYKFCVQNPRIVIHQCIEEKKYLLLCDAIPPSLATIDDVNHLNGIDENPEHLIQTFYSFAKRLLHENKNVELNNLIAQLNIKAKRLFINACMDQIAHDGGRYAWGYTELELLIDAHFCVESDHRISFTQQSNETYMTKYAHGKRLHNDCEAELKHLAPILGLEFDHDCNFHEKIFFTPACSKRLIRAGLHLTPAYLKNVLSMRNKWEIFCRAKNAKNEGSSNENNYFKFLPQELIDSIVNYACPDNMQLSDLNKLKSLPTFFNDPVALARVRQHKQSDAHLNQSRKKHCMVM